MKAYIGYNEYLKNNNRTPRIGDIAYIYDLEILEFIREDVDLHDMEYYKIEGESYFDRAFVEVDISKIEKTASLKFVTWLSKNMIDYLIKNKKIDFNNLYNEFRKINSRKK